MISHEKDKWVIDAIDGVKDTRKRNQTKAKVNLELIKDNHEEPSIDIPGNFRIRMSLNLHSALSAETGIRLVTLDFTGLLPSPIMESLE